HQLLLEHVRVDRRPGGHEQVVVVQPERGREAEAGEVERADRNVERQGDVQVGVLLEAERSAAERVQAQLLAEQRFARVVLERAAHAGGQACRAPHHLAGENAEVRAEIERRLDAGAGLELVELQERSACVLARELAEVDAERGAEVHAHADHDVEVAGEQRFRVDVHRAEVDRGEVAEQVAGVEVELEVEDLPQVELHADRRLQRLGVEAAGKGEHRAVERREVDVLRDLGGHRLEVGEAADRAADLGQGIVERALQLGRAQVLHAGQVDALQQRLGEVDARQVDARELDALEVEPAQVETGEVEARQVGEAQIDPGKISPQERNAAQIRAEQAEHAARVEVQRAAEIHAAQVEALERDAAEIEPGEIEAVQVDVADVDRGLELGEGVVQAAQVRRAEHAAEVHVEGERAGQVDVEQLRRLQVRAAQ